MMLVEATRKVGVNCHADVRDRLRSGKQIPAVAELVTQMAALQLAPA